MKFAIVGPVVCACFIVGIMAYRTEAALLTIAPGTPAGLRDLLKYDGKSLHLVGAHRGGPRPGYPENCIATFEHTLERTHALMEVDPRYTKDGIIVLHHDATLERTTTGAGRLVDHTYEELKVLRLKDPNGAVTSYVIPTLDEALLWARGKTVLVLDQKDVPVEVRVGKVQEHEAQAYAMLIVYSFDEARRCYALDRDIMMEVMIPNSRQVAAFDATGVPWSNIVAFVGHTPPAEPQLCALIHARGASCMGGTSRNLDRAFIEGRISKIGELERDYRVLMRMGIDLIETDIPRQVGPLLYGREPLAASRERFFAGSAR